MANRTLVAGGIAASTIGLLLPLSVVSLESWQRYVYSQIPIPEGHVLPTLPSPSLQSAAGEYFEIFLVCLAFGILWAAAVVMPLTLAARRAFPTPVLYRATATITVSIVTALVFARMSDPGPFVPSIA